VSLGVSHPTAAAARNNFAQLLQATNRVAEAELLMRRTLAIDEASQGSDPHNLAMHLSNLAQLLQATNRLAEAEPLMRRALTIADASLGVDHPTVATRLNNLAWLLQNSNRLTEAEPLMRRHLVIFLRFERETGYPHPNRDAAIRNYEHLLSQMGRDEAAIRVAIESAHREAGLD
jgi:tetratricopeptide (TPR) repeat protein